MIGQGLWILRKDLRHLWPRAAVFLALAALYASGDADVPRNPSMEGAGLIPSFALWLAAAFLVVSAMYEERTVGARQFWVTRPYSWKSLLLAKALFMLLCVSLPVFVMQCGVLVANGLSPAEYLPQLLARQVTLAAWTILPCAALAAVTKNLPQAVAAALTLLVVYLVMVFENLNLGLLGPTTAVEASAHAAAALLFAAAACGWQFARRGTWLGRALFACAMVCAGTTSRIIPWRMESAWVEWRSPAVDASVARLTPDISRKLQGGMGYYEPNRISVYFPIEVSGAPDGMELYSERVDLAVRAPDGKTFRSGWEGRSEGALVKLASAPDWLQANVDERFYREHLGDPVDVHASVAFTMFAVQRTPIAAGDESLPIAGHGVCNVRRRAILSVACVAPFEKPRLRLVRLPLRSDESENESGFGWLEFPFGTVFTVWERSVEGRQEPAQSDWAIETRRPVAYFERRVDLHGVVLTESGGQ